MTQVNGTDAASAAADSVASASASLSAVTVLMEQRRRYEGWIAGLDARRESTPAHVFARVHGDYTARLQVVVLELSEHADGLRVEMEALEGRLHLIEQDQQRAQDERAEGELRAHVGELSADDWATASAASDDRLAELSMSRSEVAQELARTTELLEEAQRPAAEAVPTPLEQPVKSIGDASGDAAAELIAAPGFEAPVESQDSGAPQDATPDEAPVEAPVMELSASVIAAEQQLLEIEDRRSGAIVAPDIGSAEVEKATELATPSRDTPGASRFDELAFLSSVVDAPAGEVESGPADRPDEKARRNSFAQDQARDEDVVNLSDKRRTPLDYMKAMPGIEHEGDPPFASNVTGNYPIKLTENPGEGSKTLKCGECGAVNYPTEWYCERCGAELASL